MSHVLRCLDAVEARDRATAFALAPVELRASMDACHAQGMSERLQLWATKCYLLADPRVQALLFLAQHGVSFAPVDRHYDAMMPLLLALRERYDDATTLRAMERAASMTEAHMRVYASRKMLPDLVAQCTNRDDRRSQRAKRR